MARLTATLLAAALAPWFAAAQDEQFKQAGVCARCHVISVVEWSMSAHVQAGTNCVACHGVSEGHVVDERNNVKPERVPKGAAIAGLCADCHKKGCPKTLKTASCQDCHHFHALVDPNKAPAAAAENVATHAARPVAPRRARTEALPGFESAGGPDAKLGLPREVRVTGLGIAMVLVEGGEADIGSERFASSKPVHTVRVAPFYLAKFETTRAEWKALLGGLPGAGGAAADDRLPATHVSWQDAQRFVAALNAKVPGGGFRLPTEAEWEFAVRGGADPALALADLAWYGEAESDGSPRPVGGKRPNRFGLFDVQGNVWEWCSSLSKPYPYDAGDGRESPAAAGLRSIRGGGYADSADLLDPALRHSERPDRRLRSNGLRVARSIPGS